MKYKYLYFEERFVIEKLLKAKVKIREIAKFLFRSPNTISREIKKNLMNGEYLAEKANYKAYFKRWRSKRRCLKVSMDRFIQRRDISSVSEEEMFEILSFLNYRPRKVIEFRMPGVYDYKIRLSYFGD